MKAPTKKALALVLAALTLLLALGGCGSSGKSTAPSPGAALSIAAERPQTEEWAKDAGISFDTAPRENLAGSSTGSPAPPAVPVDTPMPEGRKVVRHSDLSLETQSFDQALSDLVEAVTQAGGYIQSQDLDGRSIYQAGEYYERRANIMARVPAQQLDQVVARAGELCNLVSHSQRMDDITDHYMDTEARLSTLKLQEERLLAILEKAQRLEDVITLESALSQVRYEIESYTGSLNRMDSQVSDSFLQISLREVVEYNIQRSQPKNFWERLGASFTRSLSNLGQVLENLLFWVIEMGPVLVIYLGLLLILALAGRRIYRSWQKRQAGKKPHPPAWDPHAIRPRNQEQDGDQAPPQA